MFTVVCGAIITGVVYYLSGYRKEKINKTILKTALNNVDRLLKENITNVALKLYNDALKVISDKKEPEIYGRVKNNEGICYRDYILSKPK